MIAAGIPVLTLIITAAAITAAAITAAAITAAAITAAAITAATITAATITAATTITIVTLVVFDHVLSTDCGALILSGGHIEGSRDSIHCALNILKCRDRRENSDLVSLRAAIIVNDPYYCRTSCFPSTRVVMGDP